MHGIGCVFTAISQMAPHAFKLGSQVLRNLSDHQPWLLGRVGCTLAKGCKNPGVWWQRDAQLPGDWKAAVCPLGQVACPRQPCPPALRAAAPVSQATRSITVGLLKQHTWCQRARVKRACHLTHLPDPAVCWPTATLSLLFG